MKTKTRFHKLTAWLLTLAMLMTFIPSFTLTASAEGETSGSLSNKVSWSFDTETGVLTISGSGYMPYQTDGSQPYYQYKSQITSVVISEGITSVGGNAFCKFTKITEVSLPSTLKSIGTSAFEGTYFGSITIPNGVTTIDPSAFRDSNITSIVLPASVTKIQGSAFQNAYRLQTVEVLGDLTEVGSYAFYTCSALESVTFHGNVTKFGNNVFYRSGSKELTIYYWGTTQPEYGTSLFQTSGSSREVSHAYTHSTFLGYGIKKTTQAYSITVGNDGNGTATSDAASYKVGETVSLTATPNDGYRLKEWQIVSGNTTGKVAVVDNKMTMPASDVEVKAVFEVAPTTYTVTVATSENGTVEADVSEAAEGDTVTLTVTPADGYVLDILAVKDADDNDVTVTDNTFTMPAKAVTVTATFKAAETAPAAPSYTYELNNISDFMFAVSCTNDSHAVSNEYNIYPSGFATNGEVVKDDEGRWTCDITVRVKACFEENILKGASFSGHSAVSELPESKVFTAIWNSDTEKWEYEGDTVIYEVTCGTDNKPAAPTENNDISAVLLQFSCAEDESHVKVVNIDSAYAVAGEVTENADGEYTCDLTWNVKAAWEGSYGTDFANSFGAHTPAVELPESKVFSLKYDTASGKWTYAGETASYSVTPAYTVNIADTTNGSVSADKTKAAEGETVTLTITPANGYELDTLTVEDADNGNVTVTDNKFTMPAKAVTVTATFKVKVNYPDGTIIIPLDTNGVPTSISGTGWTYDSGTNTLTLTNGYSYAVDGECEAIVNNSGTIVGGTYNNTVNNVGDGDTTWKEQFGIINGGIFNGAVNNADGLDICTINGGTFNGTVTNKNRGVINNGTFLGEFTEILGSTINGGTFVVEFIANGGTWTTGYTVPTTYTYTDGLVLPTGENISNGTLSFDGWYDNAEFTGLPVTEIPAASSGKQTYYARFVDGIATWEAAGNLAVENTDYTVDTDGNYTVLTAKGLAKLANIVNGGDSLAGKTVTLANDINLLDGGVYQYGADTVTERNSWIPIDGFAGTFNGNGKKINDLYILTTNKDAGLFGSNVGTIKGLEIASGKVTINVSSGSELHAGGIAATTSGLIDNCINRAEIYSNDTSGSGSVYIGGITGLVSTSTGGAEVSTVSDCTNYGTVSSLGNSNCGISGGGIAGYHFSGMITGRKTLITCCVNEGTISIEPGTGGWAGGIAGTVMSNSNSNTSITATVTNCANKGSVGSNMAGGITGYNAKAAYVYNCYNMGSITGNTNAGGIVGLNYYSNATVANCYSTGSVSNATNIGGIVGRIPSGSISNCYYLSTAATEAYGYKATAATMDNCAAFTTSGSTHTLASAVYETTDLLTALKAWVSEKNVSDYMDWKADAENSNYPVLTEYVVSVTHTVTVENGTGTGNYAEGAVVTIKANTPETGYKFAGWTVTSGSVTLTDASAAETTFTMPASNVTVTATFTAKTYTVKFVDHDGKEIGASQTIEHGKAATAPADPTRTGYTFTGWDKAFNNVTSNLTVTAQYTINTYTVTFNDHDGSEIDSQIVIHGSAATAPENPVREGYNFTGWDKAFDNVTSNLTVTAQYVEKSTVTVPEITSKAYNGSVQTATIPTSELYDVTANNGGTDVGEYDVVLELKDSENYKWSSTNEKTVTLKFNITTATNSWKTEPSISDWTFGQTASTPSYEAKFGNNDVKVEYKKATDEDSAYTTTVPTNADDYKVRFSVVATTNYTALSKVVDITIAKAKVTKPEADTTVFTYNKGEQTYTLATSELYEVINNTRTDAGSQDVTVALKDKANYEWIDGKNDNLTYTFTITKAQAVITVVDTPIVKTYGDTLELPIATTNFGTVSADKTAADMVNAGNYTVTYKVEGTDNFNGATKTVSVTINPKKIDKPSADNTSFVYNGNEQTYNVDASDYYTVTDNKRTDAGSQDVIVALKDKINYTWNDGETADETFTFTIAQKDITGATIGIFAELTYTGEAQTPTATVTIDGLTVTGTWSKVTNVADKTTFTADGNFTGTIADKETGMLKANSSVSTVPGANTLTYSEAAQELVTAGAANGGTLKYSLDNATWNDAIPTGTNAGTYEVWYKVFGDANHNDTEAVKVDDVTIAKKSIEAATVALDGALTYTGAEQTQNVTVTLDGFIVTFDVTDNKATNVKTDGNYTLKVTANGNFEGEKTLEWNIAKATPAPNAEKVTTARVRRGQKLANATVTNGEFFALDGTTVLEGTFAWVDDTKEITADSTEKMKFTPTDTNYAEIEIDVAVDSYTTGGGGGSSSNTTTTTTKNEDGSTTKTTTNKSTGTTTEVTTNTDGSTTTVETKKDGTVTTTEKDADGNTTTTVENPDGTSTTTEKNKDGSETVVEKDAEGTTTTTEKDSEGNKTVTTEKADGTTTTEETKKDGTTVKTETNADGETTAQVEAKGETEVVIPVENADEVTKVVVTDKNGNETEVEFEVKDGGVAISVSGNSTVSVQTGHTCYAKDFTDVDLEAWYHLNVDYVLENGLFKGTTETTFAPNANLTRAMLVTVLYRAEGEPATNRSIPFADIDMGAYYANAVVWAQQNGIVKGVSETEFAPNDNITREQIAAIMHRYAQYKGYDVSVGENTNILSYNDFDSISEYAIGSMQWAVGSGLIKGKSESTLNPLDNATRAEIAAILHRFIENNK